MTNSATTNITEENLGEELKKLFSGENAEYSDCAFYATDENDTVYVSAKTEQEETYSVWFEYLAGMIIILFALNFSDEISNILFLLPNKKIVDSITRPTKTILVFWVMFIIMLFLTLLPYGVVYNKSSYVSLSILLLVGFFMLVFKLFVYNKFDVEEPTDISKLLQLFNYGTASSSILRWGIFFVLYLIALGVRYGVPNSSAGDALYIFFILSFLIYTFGSIFYKLN